MPGLFESETGCCWQLFEGSGYKLGFSQGNHACGYSNYITLILNDECRTTDCNSYVLGLKHIFLL